MDAKLKLLSMIQDVIKRMANNSFMLKGWTVTLVAGMIALCDKTSSECNVFIFYIPIIMFWTLDSYYLQMERKFRVLYKNIAGTSENHLDFSMSLQASDRRNKTLYYQCLLSKTELVFYLPLTVLTAITSITFDVIASG